jgi:hypothetical protein
MSQTENNISSTCSHCGESLESQFEICWNCGTSKEGEPNPEFDLYRDTDAKDTPTGSAGYIYKTLGISFLLLIIFYLFLDIPADITSHSSVFLGFLEVFIAISFIAFFAMLFYLVIRKQDDPPSKFRLLSGLYLDEQIACPHCLTINHPLSYFCITCMTPLTSHAAIDPIYRIFAQGNTYQKAAAKPANFLVVLGMWLIFGLQIPFMLWGFFGSLSGTDVTQGAYLISYKPPLYETLSELLSKVFVIISAGVMLLLYVAIVVKVTRNYLRKNE